ncbi:MAG: DUF6046 domain-containing protein [Bacteroidales bacterium]|nr:DUF6046 domain-containing protein [Bacteroidales bacterium]
MAGLRIIGPDAESLLPSAGTPTIPKAIALPPVVPNVYDQYRIGPNRFQLPIQLEIESTGTKFTFPTDPLVSITTKNIVVRRQIAKGKIRGTVKEQWSKDDYDITIAGVFNTDTEYYAEEYVEMLREIVDAEESIKLVCPYFNDNYEILRIAIEQCDFPFTPGMNSQSFTIKAKSDELYNLE